jgi:hypothetical protein
MHHIFLRCGLSSFFFERLAHRLVRECVDVLQLDHALGQQAQRPAPLAPGRPGAGQGEEMGFLLPVQLAPVEPWGRPGQQRRRQPLLHEPLAHPLDRAHAHPHRRRDRRIDPPRAAFRLVGLEQDARVGQLAGVGLAARDHALELAPLLRRERDPVPLRHRLALPLLQPSGTATGTARQTKADGALVPMPFT